MTVLWSVANLLKHWNKLSSKTAEYTILLIFGLKFSDNMNSVLFVIFEFCIQAYWSKWMVSGTLIIPSPTKLRRDMYMLSGCELIDTENISLPSQNMKFGGEWTSYSVEQADIFQYQSYSHSDDMFIILKGALSAKIVNFCYQ